MPPSVADNFIMLKPQSEWPGPRHTKAELIAAMEQAVRRLKKLPSKSFLEVDIDLPGDQIRERRRVAGQDRPWLAIGLVELVVAAVSVSLENAGVVGKMRLGMLARSVA